MSYSREPVCLRQVVTNHLLAHLYHIQELSES